MNAKEFHAWASQRYAPAPAPAPAATIMGNAPLTTTPAPPVPSAMDADDKLSTGQGSSTGAPGNVANATSEALVADTSRRRAGTQISRAAAAAGAVLGDGVPGASTNASGRVVQGQTPSTSGAAAAAAVDDYRNTILGINLDSDENALDSALDSSYSASASSDSSVGSVALTRQQGETRREFFTPSNKTRNVIELVDILKGELDPELGDDELVASSINLSKMLAGGVRAAIAATPGSAVALGTLGKDALRSAGVMSTATATKVALSLNKVGEAARALIHSRSGVDVMQPPTEEAVNRMSIYLAGLKESVADEREEDLVERRDLQVLAAAFAAAETALDSVPEAALGAAVAGVLDAGAAAGQKVVGLAKGLPAAAGARFEQIVRTQIAAESEQPGYTSPFRRSKRIRKEPEQYSPGQEEARGRRLLAAAKFDRAAHAASAAVARMQMARAKKKK